VWVITREKERERKQQPTDTTGEETEREARMCVYAIIMNVLVCATVRVYMCVQKVDVCLPLSQTWIVPAINGSCMHGNTNAPGVCVSVLVSVLYVNFCVNFVLGVGFAFVSEISADSCILSALTFSITIFWICR